MFESFDYKLVNIVEVDLKLIIIYRVHIVSYLIETLFLVTNCNCKKVCETIVLPLFYSYHCYTGTGPIKTFMSTIFNSLMMHS